MNKWIAQLGTTVLTVLTLWYVLPAKQKIIIQDTAPNAQNVHFQNLSSAPLGDFTVAAHVTLPSVVHIEVIRKNTDSPSELISGTGSGVIVDPSGYIVTNNHVIRSMITGNMLLS